MRNTKALVAALVAVVGWTVIFFALLGWWAVPWGARANGQGPTAGA